MTEHKTDLNITKIDKYKKKLLPQSTKQTSTYNNKHIQIQQRSNKPQNSPRKRLTKIFINN